VTVGLNKQTSYTHMRALPLIVCRPMMNLQNQGRRRQRRRRIPSHSRASRLPARLLMVVVL